MRLPMYIHLTARAYRLPVLLTEHAVASWLWDRLRGAFPLAVSAAIMPNHPHIVCTADSIDEPRRLFKNVFTGLRRSSNPGADVLWEPLPQAEVVPDVQHLRRLVRYVALNPCRAGLARDPLSWPWSTHRDVVGAIADPWIDAERLAAALGRPVRGFAQAHHQYVSAAPEVSVTGTPFPSPATSQQVAGHPLAALVAAVAAASRGLPEDIRQRTRARALLALLAQRHGWCSARKLAAICAVDARTVRRCWQRSDPQGLAAAELCLGDERLLVLSCESQRSPSQRPLLVHPRPDLAEVAMRVSAFGAFEGRPRVRASGLSCGRCAAADHRDRARSSGP
ncbi:MAG: hypothetical protein HY744_00400 [Deltaproteobacteria bacterium]|nr:hypothetical protein [Deltaproteobacteria bacterium]